MSFVSPEFAFAALFFFPLYWALHRQRLAQLILLLGSSYLLYASWSVDGVIVLFFYSLAVWVVGEVLNHVGSGAPKKLLLFVGLIASLMVLLVTKYYEFGRQLAVEMLPAMGLDSLLPAVDVVAPAGISFYTFQAVTYLVWRYRSPKEFFAPLRPMVFLSFWPTIFAGPILRAEKFFPQMESGRGVPMQVPRAVFIILLGLAQKMVFSNWLAETFVDAAFRYPDNLDAVGAVCAIWGYSLQIFLDFSGYSLIVTGLALLLGYEVPVNFMQPYMAVNLRDFWRRWHISLSSFIRDYIYIPLGGNQKGFFRAQFNILAAMVISGIWHGASLTFLFWGALHGLGVVVVNIYSRVVGRALPGLVSQVLTLLYVGFAWVFFRASSYDDAWLVLSALAVKPAAVSLQAVGLVAFTLVFFIFSAQAEALARWCERSMERMSAWSLYAAGSLTSFAIIFFGPSGIPAFIYYRF